MKLKLLLSIAALIIAASAIAQPIVRHVQGVKAIEISGGVSRYGTPLSLSFVKYTSNKMYWKAGVLYEAGKLGELEFSSIGLDFALNRTLKSFNEKIYFNATGGLTASMDAFADDILQIDDSGNPNKTNFQKLKYGAFIGGEAEIFFNNRYALILGGNQRILLGGEEWGRFRYFMTAGIRINF